MVPSGFLLLVPLIVAVVVAVDVAAVEEIACKELLRAAAGLCSLEDDAEVGLVGNDGVELERKGGVT